MDNEVERVTEEEVQALERLCDHRRVYDTYVVWTERGPVDLIPIIEKLLAERERMITREDAIHCVAIEEELDGSMPQELRQLPVEELLRATVRSTKHNIIERLTQPGKDEG